MTSISPPSEIMKLATQDGEATFVRRHGNPNGPRILLSHGNGLASDLYYPLWSRLTDQFDLFVYDIRNHGWNPVGDQLHHTVPNFVEDSKLITRSISARFGPKPLTGVFHSLSAVVALLHQAEEEDFAALVLFDPPISHLARPESYLWQIGDALAARASTRQAHFETRAEMAESIRRSRTFQLVLPQVPDLFAQTTLRETPYLSFVALRSTKHRWSSTFTLGYPSRMTSATAHKGDRKRSDHEVLVHASLGPQHDGQNQLRLRTGVQPLSSLGIPGSLRQRHDRVPGKEQPNGKTGLTVSTRTTSTRCQYRRNPDPGPPMRTWLPGS